MVTFCKTIPLFWGVSQCCLFGAPVVAFIFNKSRVQLIHTLIHHGLAGRYPQRPTDTVYCIHYIFKQCISYIHFNPFISKKGETLHECPCCNRSLKNHSCNRPGVSSTKNCSYASPPMGCEREVTNKQLKTVNNDKES